MAVVVIGHLDRRLRVELSEVQRQDGGSLDQHLLDHRRVAAKMLDQPRTRLSQQRRFSGPLIKLSQPMRP